MQLAHYLGLLHSACDDLAAAFRHVADAHPDEIDVPVTCRKLAADAERHAAALAPIVDRYGEEADDEADRMQSALFRDGRNGPLALLRDLHDLYLMATECDITWTLLGQAAQGTRDHELLEVVRSCEKETAIHVQWLKTRMKTAAPQALLVA